MTIPNKDTPIRDDGLCAGECGVCETSGMCARRRLSLGLTVVPTRGHLEEIDKSLKESLATTERKILDLKGWIEENQRKIDNQEYRQENKVK